MSAKKNQKKLLILVLLTIVVSSCSKIDPDAPEITTEKKDIQNQLSDIKLPLVYKVSDLDKLINQKINGIIYEDNSFENNNKDNVKLRIRKSSKIYVAAFDEKIYYDVPLHVDAELKKGILPVFKTNFELRGKFISTIDLDRYWKLHTKTDFLELIWKKKPRINLAVASIGITGKVENAIRGKMGDLISTIDTHAPKILKVKEEITKIWTSIQKPILINKKEKKVWLKIDPQKISAGRIHGKDGSIYLKLGIHSYLRTLTGDNPKYEINHRLPPLEKEKDERDTFNIFILARAPYDELNDVLKKNLKGKEFEIKGRKVKIQNAIVYGSEEHLVLKADVRGAAKGTVYFRGKPKYDATCDTFTVDDFDFDVNTRAVLVKTADWLLHGNIKEEIQEKLKFPLENQIQSLPSLIYKAIEEGKLGERIDLSFVDLDIYPKALLIAPDGIQALIVAQGKAVLQLEKFIK